MLITQSLITSLYAPTTSSAAAYTPSSTFDGILTITAVNTSTAPVTLWLYYSNAGVSTDATTIYKFTVPPGLTLRCIEKFTVKNGYSILAKASSSGAVSLSLTGIESAAVS
jgi:hypothetical protein